jgi:hypothetical protein
VISSGLPNRRNGIDAFTISITFSGTDANDPGAFYTLSVFAVRKSVRSVGNLFERHFEGASGCGGTKQ